MAKLNIIKKHAPILLILSVAFLMVGSVSTQSAFAAVPATMCTVGGQCGVTSFTDRSVKIFFTAPTSTHDITDYEMKISTDNVTFTVVPTPPGTGLFEEAFGLTTDTTYYFTVAAISSEGTGTHSSSVSQKTLGAPNNQNFQGQGQQDFGAGKSFGSGVNFEQ